MEAGRTSDCRLCSRGCGFYGSVDTKNLCSKCYAGFLREQISETLTTATTATISHLTSRQPSAATVAEPPLEVEANNQPSLTNAPAVSGKKRCRCCNKKLGLLGFQCKCGQDLCGDHRYPEKHSCDFDFKTAQRLVLATQLPEVKAEKLEKI